MTLRTVARDTKSVRTISLIERSCSKYARRISPILSTPTIPISPSRPIRAKGKDADTQRQRGSELDAKIAPQGVVIASEFTLKEVMLLIVCATIAGCDDFDEICAWGRHHLDSCAGFPSSITALRASAGCASWSIGSIRSCLDAALRVGWRRYGQTGTTSSPSTARPHGAPTTAAKDSRRCIRSAPTRLRRG